MRLLWHGDDEDGTKKEKSKTSEKRKARNEEE
jgi:hypothetical protein